jgi:hypothetical protein
VGVAAAVEQSKTAKNRAVETRMTHVGNRELLMDILF